MEVAARPNINFAVPSPASLQFSSQTFKKRTHGDYGKSDDSELINGSWTLRVEVVLEADCLGNVNYLNGAAAAEYGEDVIVKYLRVLGDMHVGRVQADLVRSLNADLPQIDLSEHKFWWPANKQWLTKSRYTLDQYGLNAECSIEFKTARRPLIVQLPDLQLRTMLVDFSATVFRVVIQICKELKLRHPEELSMMLLLSRDDQRLFALKQQQKQRKPSKPRNDESNGAGTLLSPTNGSGGEPRWTVSPTQTLNTRTIGKTPTGTAARTLQSQKGGFSGTTNRRPGEMTPASVTSPGSYYPTGTTMSRPAMLMDSNGASSPLMSTLIRSKNGNSFEPYSPLQELISTPPISITEASQRLTTSRPRGIVDKAFANACWLDSSKSLLEQGVDKNDRLMLRFKFYSFFDLKPTKPNAIRLNQLYEHSKWTILGEEIDATDEEAFNFAGLQYQIRTRQALDTSSSEDLLSNSGSAPIGSLIGGPISPTSAAGSLGVTSRPVNADDVDAAITQLQVQLETGISTRGPPIATATLPRPTSPTSPSNVSRSPASAGQENLQEIPELKDFLKISRKSRFGINKFSSTSPYWLVLRDLQLTVYRSKEEANNPNTPPIERMKLINCEVQSTVRSAADRKLVIRLFVPHADGMTEIVLKAKNVQQYAVWLAAFRLASRGKTMADASYEAEVQNVLSSLTSPSRQSAGSKPPLVISSPLSTTTNGNRSSPNPPIELNIAEYLPQSVAKRYKQKEMINRILEAHSRVSALSSTEAKMAYIKQWEALPYFDVSYFLVRIVQIGSNYLPQNTSKTLQFDQLDVMGVCPNKLIRYDSPKTMSILQVWPFERITSWQVDWEKRVVRVESEDGVVAFSCASSDCKVFHELFGGYIFMALRSSAQNKQLDEEMFQKLTGGRD